MAEKKARAVVPSTAGATSAALESAGAAVTSGGPQPSTDGTADTRAGKKQPVEVKDSVREVVETIVFVVVLVLLLKMFVAEAFVIPTGSMAETLWGYQKVVECPDCKFVFPVNCSTEVEGDGTSNDRIEVRECKCPNCGLDIDFRHEVEKGRMKSLPLCTTGDRVLVAKFLNDTHLAEFKPFDVVVFKFPEEPQHNQVPMNYIKRLIGMPGKTVGILNGDLYLADLDYDHLDEKLANDLQERPADERRLEEERRAQAEADENEMKLPLRRRLHKGNIIASKLLRATKLPETGEPVFHILRKDPERILAMRRIVYDNDHRPKALEGKKYPPRWAPEYLGLEPLPDLPADERYLQLRRNAEAVGAWKAEGASFRHDPTNAGVNWLRYRQLVVSRSLDDELSGKPPAAERITDVLGYNSNRSGSLGSNWVGDLILEFDVKVEKPQGELILELSKGVDRFRAAFNLASGLCTLFRVDDHGQTELGREQTAVKRAGQFKLRFANVDERLTLWVDRDLPFGHGVAYTPPVRPGKDGTPRVVRKSLDKNDLEPASIGVREAQVTVEKLKLWRDTYYTQPSRQGIPDTGSPESGTDEAATLYVQPGHYLCLGDNSAASSDSRSWGRQSQNDSRGGLVPQELMLGRAILVYYPFEFPYWPLYTPVNRVGLIR